MLAFRDVIDPNFRGDPYKVVGPVEYAIVLQKSLNNFVFFDKVGWRISNSEYVLRSRYFFTETMQLFEWSELNRKVYNSMAVFLPKDIVCFIVFRSVFVKVLDVDNHFGGSTKCQEFSFFLTQKLNEIYISRKTI